MSRRLAGRPLHCHRQTSIGAYTRKPLCFTTYITWLDTRMAWRIDMQREIAAGHFAQKAFSASLAYRGLSPARASAKVAHSVTGGDGH